MRVKKYFLCLLLILLIIPEAFSQQSDPSYWYGRGMASMMREDWYGAAESFLECVRLNPAHADGNAALADCYYELGEFDEALLWARKARLLARGNLSLANLEASILIALGLLDEASVILNEVLAREPYNREALFTAAELDIARGRSGDAVIRYREAVRRYPDDRRLLVSLALVLGSLGDTNSARTYIERALLEHPNDYRVYYYAAYLASRENRIAEAVNYVQDALYHRPAYFPALSLLASLRYRSGQYQAASDIADELIRMNRDNALAWYMKGISLTRLGRNSEALNVLSNAVIVDGEDEFIRVALEELLISTARLEDPARARWAAWHFTRAREFRSRNLMEQALFEYRRGLRLNPYARDRYEYAELLRLQGYPARYLEELKFMQDLGFDQFDTRTAQALNDAIETYDSLLGNALFRRWDVDPVSVTGPHWKIAVFAVSDQASFFHTDAGAAASSYIKDILVHERNISPMDLPLRQASFSGAFREARESGADYFMIISAAENERDISINAELFVARTGGLAARFNSYRTGQDRLRNASRGIVDQLSAALPFRAELIRRNQGQGLIDKGRSDGVKVGDVFDLVRRGSITIQNEGVGISYSSEDISGRITITAADEEVSAGTLERNGFFDRIIPGDEVILVPAETNQQTVLPVQGVNIVPGDPELRALLRTLR